MTHFTIYKTITGQTIASILATVTVTVQTRDPVAYWTINIPNAQWPNIEDVPAIYRGLVGAVLLNNAESILSKYVKDSTKSKASIPESLFSLECLVATTTNGRLTAADLINQWKQSHKYIYDVTAKLTSKVGSDLLKYKANIEKHEKRIAALASAKPEEKLSAKDVQALLNTLTVEDQDTPFGQLVMARCELVLEKQAIQDDAI